MTQGKSRTTPKRTNKRQNTPRQRVAPGMRVATTEGDLGQRDITPPKIEAVERDAQGHVQDVIVQKGTVFKKEIVVPADRIIAVDPQPKEDAPAGTVTIATNAQEVNALSAVGEEDITKGDDLTAHDIIDEAQEQPPMPTDVGMRRKEARNAQPSATPTRASATVHSLRDVLHLLGPGFLGGMSGNDASAVTTYAVTGATTGFSQLWLMLLATPLLQCVLFACGAIGRITQHGFADLLRLHYGRKVALPVAGLLLVANIALIAGDLVAIGSGFQLITGITWEWFVVPAGAFLWYMTVYQSFDTIKKVFMVLSLAFIAYLITGFLSGAHWGAVLRGTFVPSLSFNFVDISSIVALLGATLSPYTMFWQVQGEKEEQRPGTKRVQVRLAAWDIFSGVLSGNLIAYFIIVCTSATLFAHHQSITTAADAARSLQPLLGPFAKYLFAAGLIGAGMVAIPVLLASTGYVLTGSFNWAASLWKKPWQNEGFYLILTVALVASLALALLRFNPVQLMFWANILQSFLAPILIVLLLILGNNRSIMGPYRLRWLTNTGLGLAALVLVVGVVFLVVGLATGGG